MLYARCFQKVSVRHIPDVFIPDTAAVPATNFLISSYRDWASWCLISSTWGRKHCKQSQVLLWFMACFWGLKVERFRSSTHHKHYLRVGENSPCSGGWWCVSSAWSLQRPSVRRSEAVGRSHCRQWPARQHPSRQLRSTWWPWECPQENEETAPFLKMLYMWVCIIILCLYHGQFMQFYHV